MRAKNYCADCDFHFNSTAEEHAAEYHEGGLFRGVMGGDWRDYERNLRTRKNNLL